MQWIITVAQNYFRSICFAVHDVAIWEKRLAQCALSKTNQPKKDLVTSQGHSLCVLYVCVGV